MPMAVVRFIRRLLVAVLASVGFAVLTSLAVLAYLFWDLTEHLDSVFPAELPESITVHYRPSAGLIDDHVPGTLGALGLAESLSLRQATAALRQAAADERVTRVVLDLGAGELTLVQAQTLREAVSRLRDAGKTVTALADTYLSAPGGDTSYYLAAGCDEIWLQPSGEVGLTGVVLQTLFIRGLLDRVGVTPQLAQREAYKGFMNSFTDHSMPAEVGENLDRLAASWAEQIIAGIATGRGLPEETARSLLEGGPYRADDAKKLKLIDGIAYADQVFGDIVPDPERFVSLADYHDAVLGIGSGDFLQEEEGTEIALIHVHGAIMRGESEIEGTIGIETVRRAIGEAVEEDDVAALILWIDSPGGSYVASDTLWRLVHRVRDSGKPVIAWLGNVAASGGYFVAMASDRIVARPATLTGSIGVVAGKFVIADLLERLGVGVDSRGIGARADMYSLHRRFSQEEWAFMNRQLDAVYADFTRKVALDRGYSPEAVADVAGGRVFTGRDALANGLVDELGGMNTVLAAVRTALKLPEDAPLQVVDYPRDVSTLETLLGAMDGSLLTGRAVLTPAVLERLLPGGIAGALATLLQPPSALDVRLLGNGVLSPGVP